LTPRGGHQKSLTIVAPIMKPGPSRAVAAAAARYWAVTRHPGKTQVVSSSSPCCGSQKYPPLLAAHAFTSTRPISRGAAFAFADSWASVKALPQPHTAARMLLPEGTDPSPSPRAPTNGYSPSPRTVSFSARFVVHPASPPPPATSRSPVGDTTGASGGSTSPTKPRGSPTNSSSNGSPKRTGAASPRVAGTIPTSYPTNGQRLPPEKSMEPNRRSSSSPPASGPNMLWTSAKWKELLGPMPKETIEEREQRSWKHPVIILRPPPAPMPSFHRRHRRASTGARVSDSPFDYIGEEEMDGTWRSNSPRSGAVRRGDGDSSFRMRSDDGSFRMRSADASFRMRSGEASFRMHNSDSEMPADSFNSRNSGGALSDIRRARETAADSSNMMARARAIQSGEDGTTTGLPFSNNDAGGTRRRSTGDISPRGATRRRSTGDIAPRGTNPSPLASPTRADPLGAATDFLSQQSLADGDAHANTIPTRPRRTRRMSSDV
jgi:hypothetical protein